MPEISLYTAGPRSGLWRLAEHDDAFGAPYWAHLWGGGLALARHVLDNPALVSGRRVLDLGAGSGIVGIAAAKAGASAVVAADVDPYAMAAIELNAEANAVSITTRLGDLSAEPVLDFDIVLVGDLFYDEALAERITALLNRCLASGVLSLIGDPCRAYLPRSRLRLLAEYPGPDFSTLTLGQGRTNSVFLFDRDTPDPQLRLPRCDTWTIAGP
ncbi:MAG TPA: 50S ribosomal protein L11 methyltransferase [Rhizobium sp.]|nr:50S ribosomal protein L11 methyltransferase [Rhizobium sp.]